jgi:hypothetical protein
LTKPSISWGPGFLDDCTDLTSANWSPTDVGLGAALTVAADDYFLITAAPDSVAAELTYWDNDITNLSTTTYTKYYVRWKTSVASNGVGLCVYLLFDDATNDCIVGGATEEAQFSTEYTVSTGTITSGKTIDKIRILVKDSPATVASGTFYIYLDFILICRNSFTFPNALYGVRYIPAVNNMYMVIPSRYGEATQNLGNKLATVNFGCNLDRGNWKRTGDLVNGQVFEQVWQDCAPYPWLWLNTGLGRQFKASMDEPVFTQQDKEHRLDLTFHEYRRSNALDNETLAERLGYNL